MSQKVQTLYLLDGHAQLYRAYHVHARENRRATDGTPTGALYGFFNQLRTFRTRFKPELLGCVFDPKEGTFREREFQGYKAHRAPMPEELRQQIPLALELCRGYGIPALQIPDFEADDILGALAKQAVALGYQVVIITGDKDLLQLVTDQVKVYDPMKDILYDPAVVEELKELKPTQMVDLLGLMGDAADNIPGVEGVGEQTAVKLLREHGSLEATLEHFQEKFKDRKQELYDFVAAHQAEAAKEKAERKTLKPPKGVKVVEAYLFAQAQQARASRELARLIVDAPVTFNPGEFVVGEPNRKALVPLLQRLDFRQLLREVGGTAEADLFTLAEQKAQTEAAQREYRIVDTPAQLEAFARSLAGVRRLAVDTETTSLHPIGARLVGLSFSWRKGEAYYLPLRGPNGAQVLPEKRVWELLRGPLEDPKLEKIGQNAKYDLLVLRGAGVELKGIAFDTLIAGWLLNPGALRHDLDSLAYDYLGLRKIATESLIGAKGKPPTMDLVPVADVAQYACEDADVTFQLAEVLQARLVKDGLDTLLHQLEVPLIPVLAEMEWSGVRIDPELLREMSQSLETQLAAQEEEICRLSGERFAINSPKQLGQILYQKLGLPVLARTNTGQAATNEEVLAQLAQQHELPRLVLEYRQFHKLKSTYVDALPLLINPATDRVHASFNQTGTETGRLSSSDPNLQNIPIRSEFGRSIRAAFKPSRAGWKLLTADYSQIELRILAHYSRDPNLLRAFADGQDIHRSVAARLFKVPESQVTREQRARAKTVNFGVLYGQSAFGLAQTLGLPRAEAKTIIDDFFEEHPGVKECLNRIVAEARKNGYVTTLLGRRRFVPQLAEKAQEKFGERIAINTVFQGSAADLIKKAMLEIHQALKDPRASWQTHLLLQIHDELLFECPEGEAKELARLVKKKMEGALVLAVPLVVEIALGDDWLSAKE